MAAAASAVAATATTGGPNAKTSKKRNEKEAYRAKWQRAITNDDLIKMVKTDQQKILQRRSKLVRRKTKIDGFLTDLSHGC